MKKYLFFLIWCMAFVAQAQMQVKGTVIAENTQQKLAGISIYINNSSIGTVTDDQGKFTLTLPFKGKMELVVSHVNYQKEIILIDAEQQDELSVALKLQDYTLNEVVIKAAKNKDDNFKKWGALFTEILIGRNTQFTRACKITNPEVLVFAYKKETTTLNVFAPTPIIIENRALGYRIKLDLTQFKYTFATDVVSFQYSSFFESLITKSANTAEQVKHMRNLAYFGSKIHFMRTLYARNLSKEGFSLFAYKAISNKEKQRVAKLIQQQIGDTFNSSANSTYRIDELFKNKDTATYYKRVMEQHDVLAYDTTRLSIQNLSTFNRNLGTMAFKFNDTLLIKFKIPAIAYNATVVQKKQINLNAKKAQVQLKDKLTYLYFVADGNINIEKNGYYPETNLFIFGDMSERRISQLLPWDFEPEL